MDFTNLNIFSIIIFLLLNIVLLIIFYFSYKKQLIINDNFKKLSRKKNTFVKYIFLYLSFFVLSLSIFWLRWNSSWYLEKDSVDVVFVLDVSKSMNVYDIFDSKQNYSRLDFAKNAIWNFVINNSENRYSLVIFAWEAISKIPLTSDINLFLTILDNVDYRSLTVQWTNFSEAFELWFERLIYSDDNSKALIFVSDWWENDDEINEKFLTTLRENNKNDEVLIVWIWSKDWWKIITWRDFFWRIQYHRFNWEDVISKLNENNLLTLKNILFWDYLKLDDTNDLLKFSKIIDKLERKITIKNSFWEFIDYSRYLSFISFFFFLLFIIFYTFESNNYFLKKKYE